MNGPLQDVILVVLLLSLVTLTFILLRLIRAQKAQQGTLNLKEQLADMRRQSDRLLETLHSGQLKEVEMMQQQFKNVVDTLHNHQQSAQTNLRDHLKGTGETLNRVHSQLAGLEKTAAQLAGMGRDINKLNDLLKAPKLRGQMGEILLEKLLAQILPREHYGLQHTFKNGTMVDAVIRLGDNMLVPVDSKFPLDAFQRSSETDDAKQKKRELKQFYASVRRQIDDIAAKYINPNEGTHEFALMYIPAESVYYQIITADEPENDLIAYALDSHVIPVSPNTFYAFLMVIVYGLRGLRIEQEARQIRAQLGTLEHGFRTFHDSFQVLGRHIGNAQGRYNDVDKQMARFSDQLAGISGRSELPSGDGDGDGADPLPAPDPPENPS